MVDTSSTSEVAAAPQPELFSRLQARLEPFRAAALGIAEGVQAVSPLVIASIQSRKPEGLKKSWKYNEIEGQEWYELVKQPKLLASNCKNTVEAKLWRAAIMHRMCQKVIYCLISKVRAVLQGKYHPYSVSPNGWTSF